MNSKTMRISVSLILVLVMAAACMTAALATDEKTPTIEVVAEVPAVVGGWNAPESPEITPELKAYFDEAMSSLIGVSYEPVEYLGYQVVAGMKYAFLCNSSVVYPGAETKQARVVIFVDLDNNASLFSIDDLDAEAQTDPAQEAEKPDGEPPEKPSGEPSGEPGKRPSGRPDREASADPPEKPEDPDMSYVPVEPVSSGIAVPSSDKNAGSSVPEGSSSNSKDAFRLGDPSADDEIDDYDAALILRVFVGLGDEIDPAVGDVSGDGEVDDYDAALILRFFVGLISGFSA